MAVDESVRARLQGMTDDRVGDDGPRENVQDRQMLTTPSWQVASIPMNAVPKKKGSRIGLTENKRAQVALNVYPPHRRDEMHCHPGSEHIFLCWEGHLTIRGINEGEEVTLSPGDFVHVKAGHYYQLCNDTEENAVMYQVATRPVTKPPTNRRSFRRAGDVDAEAINTRGLTPEMLARTVWD